MIRSRTRSAPTCLRSQVAGDETDAAAGGDVEDAAAGGAVADGRVSLHRLLEILLVELELADDARRDAQRAAVRRADHHHVIAHVHLLADRNGGERFAFDREP